MYPRKMTPENIKKMSQGIAFSALAVGSLIAGKRYYDNYKLNKVIHSISTAPALRTFFISVPIETDRSNASILKILSLSQKICYRNSVFHL